MLSLVLAATFSFQAPGAAAPTTQDSLRVLVSGPAGEVRRLDALGFHDHSPSYSIEGSWLVQEVIVPEAELPALRAAVPASIVKILERSRPLRDKVAEWRRIVPDLPDPNYRTPAEILAGLQALEAQFPTLAKLWDFQSRWGTPLTHNGRRVYGLRISDNPGVDEDEPNLVVFANNHCRELNTIEVAFMTAENLLNGYATNAALKKIVDQNQVWIIPTMNPDGLDFVWTSNDMWRKNRRNNGGGSYGVDLNRNYPYFWSRCGSSSSPSSDTYHGPSAGSEPEAQMMLAFAQAEGIERLIDFHSYARDVRTPHNSLITGNLPSMVTSFYAPLHQAIASAMSYQTNTSCCCGTHMEWHHSLHGTMAFLVEMGDAFQPPFPSTVTELARVWPGVELFLTKPVPMRGHVRSMDGNRPLLAKLTVAGQPFADGQKIDSLGRHGRYHLWIAPGTYDVTFTAPGHVAKTLRVSLVDGQTLVRDVVLEPSLRPAVLQTAGTPQVGQTVDLNLASPDDAGRQYFLPVSLWDAPPIVLGERTIPIAASFLLNVQLAATTVFVNTFGTLDGSGQATGRFAIPNDPNLVGFDFWFAGLTFQPSYPFGIRGISNNVRLRVAP
jgi:hypothetical protein